jgi:hypothetical protein
MLSVAYKTLMLSVFMLNVVMLSVVMKMLTEEKHSSLLCHSIVDDELK